MRNCRVSIVVSVAVLLLCSFCFGETIALKSPTESSSFLLLTIDVPRGGGEYFIPAGYNPFGYKITALGEEFLKYEGSLDSDVGRFIASLKTGRKRFSTIKAQWLEVMRVSKSGQNMRIYRMLQELLGFCIKAGLVD